MNGSIIKNTPIIVDFWKNLENSEEKLYFLTHLHSDHVQGLTSSWRYPIYTSPENCILLKTKFKLKEELLVGLELDVPHLIPLNNKNRPSITVVLTDANHVPGAVAFLFQGPFGNVFYCGDLRLHPEMFDRMIFSNYMMEGAIDYLYLDNTFCSPRYDFPSRESATEQVFNIIENHSKHTVKLGVRNFGKESLLEAVAREFSELILVGKKKFEQLKELRRPAVYTTDYTKSRIHAINIHWINEKQQEKWNSFQPTISIRLTAIDYGVPADAKLYANSTKGIFTVPYSDHSSWGELMCLVQRFRPRHVIPIVKHKKGNDQISIALEGRDDMSVFDKFLYTSPNELTNENDVNSLQVESDFTEYPFIKYPIRLKMFRKRRRALSKGVIFTSLPEKDEDKCNRESVTSHRLVINKKNEAPINHSHSPQHKQIITSHSKSETENNESKLIFHKDNHHSESKVENYEGYRDKEKCEDLSLKNITSDTRLLIHKALRESDIFFHHLKTQPQLETSIVLREAKKICNSLQQINEHI